MVSDRKPLRVLGYRGRFVETEHQIVYAVVSDGKVIDYGGDIDLNRAMRSSAKPIQALVCIETGAADAYRFTDSEIAVMASSHDGGEVHIRAVRSMLRKCGLSERYLQCGPTGPINRRYREKILLSGKSFLRIHHNCSGKHAGALAASKYMNWSLRNYRSPDHPWNRRVFELISLFTGIPVEEVGYAVDGCGIPVVFCPIRESALAFARYASLNDLPERIEEGCRRLIASVNRHPYHNSGYGRFLAALYRVAPDRFIAKEGGQGVFCLGVVGQNFGLALKTLDGRNISYNPYEPAVVYLLKRHGLLREAEAEQLAREEIPIRNSRNEIVGRLTVSE